MTNEKQTAAPSAHLPPSPPAAARLAQDAIATMQTVASMIEREAFESRFDAVVELTDTPNAYSRDESGYRQALEWIRAQLRELDSARSQLTACDVLSRCNTKQSFNETYRGDNPTFRAIAPTAVAVAVRREIRLLERVRNVREIAAKARRDATGRAPSDAHARLDAALVSILDLVGHEPVGDDPPTQEPATKLELHGRPVHPVGIGDTGRQDGVQDMRFCEIAHLQLHAGVLYRFSADPNCDACRRYVETATETRPEDRCMRCGNPRSHHPFRHPFVTLESSR